MKNRRKVFVLLTLVMFITVGTIVGMVIYLDRSNGEIILEEVLDDEELLVDVEELKKSQEEMLEGIRHYEYLYATDYNSDKYKIYDRVMRKYFSPVLTTVKDYKWDFPLEDRLPSSLVSMTYQSFNLKDDEKVWVYTTCLDNHVCDKVIFMYDELDFTEEGINIKTHFETIKHISSSAGEGRLIVVSIIPAEQ
ncbi:MAG: hypothetical protein K6G69_04800 [Lachnospiraceae bacterium]|nr:hypothetical protein [Lachnospiraceae bacterium]